MLLKRNTNYYKIVKYQLGFNRCTCSMFAINHKTDKDTAVFNRIWI